jgi:hypothetical protein
MDEFAREALARMPLAEAVLQVWRWIASDERVELLFERHRGRCRTGKIGFPLMVHLIADALTAHGGSARRSFEKAIEGKELEASIVAAYGKLRRLPIEVKFVPELLRVVRDRVPGVR